jgi:Zn-finger nucleic acid-binding protein
VRVEFQALTVHRCTQCRGIFLDGNTFDYMVQRATQRVLDESEKGVRRRVQRGAPDSRLAYIPCPVCGQQMSRRNYARCSGVVFDQCLRDGVWLDDTELQQILTFIATGGHQLAKVIQEEAEQRLRLARQRAQSDALWSRSTVWANAGWTLAGGLWNN